MGPSPATRARVRPAQELHGKPFIANGPNQSRKPRIVRPTITTQSQGTNGPRHTTGPETPHTFCGPKARTKNQMIERPKGETQASLFTAQDGNASQDTYSQGLTMTMVHRPPTDSTGSHALNGGPANIRQPWCQRPPPIIRKANSQTGPPRISRKTISATGPHGSYADQTTHGPPNAPT